MNNKRNWDTMLPSILYAYRTKVHKTLNISLYEALFGLAPRNINDDSLYKLGMRLGLERLYFLMDKQVNQEEKVFKENEPPIKSLSKIEIGDQVIMMKHLKKDKLDDTYKKKIYTVVDKFHRNTFILVNSEGVKLKRAVNGAHLKNFVQRQAANLKLINAWGEK
ncbi:hypothetical protein G6F43_006661 [Rhizopus delemar]|nr:hypothetical protein G6F43_006661 [Rhizopus delemar]